jgi:hypothetical protein
MTRNGGPLGKRHAVSMRLRLLIHAGFRRTRPPAKEQHCVNCRTDTELANPDNAALSPDLTVMHDVSGYTFYRDVFGGWRWECYDSAGEALDSRESFDTSNECIDDARHDKHRRGGLTTQTAC